MRQLDRYGVPEHRYDGVGEVQFADGRDATRVYFDARQLPDATIIVGCIALDGSILRDPTELTGRTLDGRSFRTVGLMMLVSHRLTNDYQAAELLCREIRVGADETLSTFEPVRFAIYNYAFGQRDTAPLHPIELEWGGFHISLAAVDDYAARVAQLRSAGGAAHTAWCEIAARKALPEREFPLDDARALADDIGDALSLATGTLVSWHYCIGTMFARTRTQEIHQAAVSKTFAKLVINHGWFVDAADVIRAWLDYPVEATIGRDDLRIYVRQHCDSCSEEPFFETRGLSAATLLDVIAGRYAERTETDHLVAPGTWRSAVLPLLRSAVEASSELTEEQRTEALQGLTHLYRRSFKRKLRKLLEDFVVPVKPGTLTRAIDSRNALTHAGHFHSHGAEKHFEEYLRLVLLARCILLGLAGVKNDLHKLLV